jgi:hypothetical protein
MKISKREKIILGLTVLALIYAGIVFFFPGPGSTVSRPGSDEDSAEGLMTEVVQSLARHHRTETEQIILEKAQIPWPPDEPFIPATAPSPGEPKTGGETIAEAGPEGFSFTGYVEIGNKRLAIINGEEYETGDRITGSPFTIRGISKEQVRLGDEGNRIRVVPMADDTAR